MRANKIAAYCCVVMVCFLYAAGVSAYICINRLTNSLNREVLTQFGKCSVTPIYNKAPKKKHNHIHKNKGNK